MDLSILAIGRMKSGPEQELFETYLKRSQKSGRQLGFGGPHILQFAESRAKTTQMRKKEEAETLLSAAGSGFVIALDENGKDISSPDFAAILRQQADNGEKQLSIAIGGPDGHGSELMQRANLTLRLGKMTWPHQIARILLAEQVYRAMTILSGHPYHRQ